MSNFEIFMIKEELEKETIDVYLKEYKTKDGKPYPLKLQKLPLEEVLKLQSKNVINGKINTLEYSTDLAVASMIEPNLRDVKLQEFYKVFGEKALFFKIVRNLFNYTKIVDAVIKLYGLNESLEDEVEKAKNLLNEETF